MRLSRVWRWSTGLIVKKTATNGSVEVAQERGSYLSVRQRIQLYSLQVVKLVSLSNKTYSRGWMYFPTPSNRGNVVRRVNLLGQSRIDKNSFRYLSQE